MSGTTRITFGPLIGAATFDPRRPPPGAWCVGMAGSLLRLRAALRDIADQHDLTGSLSLGVRFAENGAPHLLAQFHLRTQDGAGRLGLSWCIRCGGREAYSSPVHVAGSMPPSAVGEIAVLLVGDSDRVLHHRRASPALAAALAVPIEDLRALLKTETRAKRAR